MSEPYRKKLIEVALPLEAINVASAREKSIRHGHPSTLHLWWARRPLAACRAVLFASIVDDPSSRPDLFPTEEEQDVERQRLFRIVEELVKWENSTNEKVLGVARAEILKATDGNPPPVLDPFCGGGSIPLEAQRLGLEAHASDLNPVAVLITKALVEIPPKFAGKPPVNPESRAKLAHGASWNGAQGLAEDVRYYGAWMRNQAFERIGHMYPEAKLPDGRNATVIAWLWARTVTCPNPACGTEMPLMSSLWLVNKPNRKRWLEPETHARRVRFRVAEGAGGPPDGPKTARGANFRCIACGEAVGEAYIKDQGRLGRMGSSMVAMVAKGTRERVYVEPDDEHVAASRVDPPEGVPSVDLVDDHRNIWCVNYGFTTTASLFTPRQLCAVETFRSLLDEVEKRALSDGASGEYVRALRLLLAFAVDRAADAWSSLVSWRTGVEATRSTFARQALPMVWDFAEANPFSNDSGNWSDACVAWVAKVIEAVPASVPAHVLQLDATAALSVDAVGSMLVSTDPPYYDNISYADLSDFFYVWLRASVRDSFGTVVSTIVTPKTQELVAMPHRFGGDRKHAERFFEEGLLQAFTQMRVISDPSYPVTVYYAFRQAEETSSDGVASTGWETMLSGLLGSGFSVTGTWPMRTERGGRSVGIGTNALASSIVLVCRPRAADAPMATRREFVNALRSELPVTLKQLQHGNIAPVDLAQAAIGPGMAVFSRYAKVLEGDGQAMKVRAALGLINQTLDEILAEQEGDFDPDTRFAVTWFEQRGVEEGPFGEADVLARAKNTSVEGLERAGVLVSRAGKVRLLRRDELALDWDPASDVRLTVWETAQHLIKRLDEHGEDGAAELLRRVGGLGEVARELAYRLYTTCERKGWAQEALAYNSLVVAWPEIARRVAGTPEAQAQQVLEV